MYGENVIDNFFDLKFFIIFKMVFIIFVYFFFNSVNWIFFFIIIVIIVIIIVWNIGYRFVWFFEWGFNGGLYLIIFIEVYNVMFLKKG